jgi:small subunit ribosomal protein S6
MNYYEHTLIAKQDLSDTQNKKLYEKYESIISKNSGKIIKTEEWGLRNLAKKTKNNTKGIYYHIKFEGVGKTIEELERAENIDEVIIRFLTVKVKKHDLEVNYFDKKELQKYTDTDNEEKQKV